MPIFRNCIAIVLSLGALVAACASSPLAFADEPPPPNKWEKAITDFEDLDRENPPPKGEIVFVGSSSIRLWDTAKAFPDRKIINRGFGGSQIADSVHFADRIVVAYAPRLIVFYAGDNDIAAGKTAVQVAADFKAFVERIHAKLPDTRVAFIAIKPSPARWKFFETQQKANGLIAEFVSKDKQLVYIDVVKPMLGADGMPREELFRKDRLHLNDEGYAVWNEIVGTWITRLSAGSR